MDSAEGAGLAASAQAASPQPGNEAGRLSCTRLTALVQAGPQTQRAASLHRFLGSEPQAVFPGLHSHICMVLTDTVNSEN